MVHLGFAQVGIHQQHPLAHLDNRFGQEHVGEALAFGRQGAGEGYRTHGPVGVEEAQGGEEVAQGFLIEETLVAGEAGSTIGAGVFPSTSCWQHGGIQLLQQETLVFPHTFEEGHVGDVAQQGLAEVVFDLHWAVEYVVEAVAKQAGTGTGHQAEHHPEGEVAGHRGLHGVGVDLRGGDHLPGHGALGDFELEVFAGLDEAGKIFLGDLQFLLEGFVLLDQGWLLLEATAQLGDLALGRGKTVGVEGEGCINGLELVAAQ